LLNGVDAPNLRGLEKSIELQTYNAIKNANPRKDREGYVAFTFLDQGKLADAEEREKRSKSTGATILIAASQGATEEMQQRGLDVAVDEISQHGKLYMAALSARNDKPYDKYLDSYIENDSSTRSSAAEALRKILESRPRRFPEDALKGLNPAERGYVMAAAVTFAPNAVPEQWKQGTKRLLFCVERPWFELK